MAAIRPQELAKLETDPRFPSGKWTGFFQQRLATVQKSWMELELTFSEGRLEGAGRDWVGEFLMRGVYSIEDGRCQILKTYIGKHGVSYAGYNEGKGIWGQWRIQHHGTGGFYIWPKLMGDPTIDALKESEDLPIADDELLHV